MKKKRRSIAYKNEKAVNHIVALSLQQAYLYVVVTLNTADAAWKLGSLGYAKRSCWTSMRKVEECLN